MKLYQLTIILEAQADTVNHCKRQEVSKLQTTVWLKVFHKAVKVIQEAFITVRKHQEELALFQDLDPNEELQQIVVLAHQQNQMDKIQILTIWIKQVICHHATTLIFQSRQLRLPRRDWIIVMPIRWTIETIQEVSPGNYLTTHQLIRNIRNHL